MLQVGNALQAASFVLYPFVDQVWSVALVVVASVIGRTAFWGSYSPMVTLISPPGSGRSGSGSSGRCATPGFAIGGVVAGVALTVDATMLYYAVALLNAASYVLSLCCSPASRVDEGAGPGTPIPADVVGGWGTVLRDRRLPLAGRQQLRLRDDVGGPQRGDPRVRRGDARPARLGVGGGVRHQHADDRRRPGSGRAADDRRGARADRRARAVLSAASFLVLLGARPLGVAAASAVVLVGAVVYTLGELVADRCWRPWRRSRRRRRCAGGTSRRTSCRGTSRPASRRCSTPGCWTSAARRPGWGWRPSPSRVPR